MLIKIKKNEQRKTALILLSMFFLLLISLCSNAGLIYFCAKIYDRQRVVTVPMIFDNKFVSDNTSADINLINMMVRSFINLRLNVTPENIDSQHKIIMRYASPSYAPVLKKSLVLESMYIKDGAISSVFFIEKIKYLPTSGDSIVSGRQVSTTTHGELKIPDEDKSYRIHLRYINGVVELSDFTLIKAKHDND